MASEYDIIIIGGGPAGLSAAASIVRQHHKTVLFDSGKYRNAESRHMHTVATWDHRDPKEFRDAAKKDFERYGTVTVEDVEIETVKKRDDGSFEVTSAGKKWLGKKLILTSGVEDVYPNIPGYAECWVKGIFHCLYCHGWEEKDSPSAGVLAEGDIGALMPALHFARQALRMSKEVTIYTNGNDALAKEITAAVEAAPAPMKTDARELTKLEKAPERSQITLHFKDGTNATEAFLAHKPKFRLRGDLAQQLGVELAPPGTIKVTPPFNQTSVRGVFAAGDCSSPMQIVTAALSSGSFVGAAAPAQLQAESCGQRSMF